jgi:hypothetical protein
LASTSGDTLPFAPKYPLLPRPTPTYALEEVSQKKTLTQKNLFDFCGFAVKILILSRLVTEIILYVPALGGLGVCGALPKNRINLQFIANLYLTNSQGSLVNRNFCMNMQKFTKVPQAPRSLLSRAGY